MTNYSPLRYPGGKTKLYPVVKNIIEQNHLLKETYVEPFAGGAGLALKLLIEGDVKRIVINDYDPAIYSFWFCVLNYCDELCEFIETVDLSIDEWNYQKSIYLSDDMDVLSLGKATFYLNRTNVSGIIKGGVIGGKEQNGLYKLNARFNRENLVNRIRLINSFAGQIELYNMDVFDFVKPDFLRKYYKIIINFDPPYVQKGDQLYKNSFTKEDHCRLSQQIKECKRKWILTYDDCELTRELYKKYNCGNIDVNYSVNTTKKAKELIVFSKNIVIPEEIEIFK